MNKVAHYNGFVGRCQQYGLTKVAADMLYKEALIGAGLRFFGKGVGLAGKGLVRAPGAGKAVLRGGFNVGKRAVRGAGNAVKSVGRGVMSIPTKVRHVGYGLQNVGQSIGAAGGTVDAALAQASRSVGNAALSAGRSVGNAALSAGRSVGNAALGAGNAVLGAGRSVGNAALSAGTYMSQLPGRGIGALQRYALAHPFMSTFAGGALGATAANAAYDGIKNMFYGDATDDATNGTGNAYAAGTANP